MKNDVYGGQDRTREGETHIPCGRDGSMCCWIARNGGTEAAARWNDDISPLCAMRGGGGRGLRKTGLLPSSAAFVRVRASQRAKDLGRVDVRPTTLCLMEGGWGMGQSRDRNSVFFIIYFFGKRVCPPDHLRPRLNGPSGRGTVGSSHRHSLACVCMYAFLALLRQQSHFAASGVSSWCTLPTVRPRVTPYQGFRYTPAARMRARCSGHRYQTESSALAVKSLSVDSVCARFQALRISAILCVCVCVCVCVRVCVCVCGAFLN